MTSFFRLSFVMALIFAGSISRADSIKERDYQKLNPSCATCTTIDDLLVKYSVAIEVKEKIAISFKVADAIEKTVIKGKPGIEQNRAFYFAIKGAAEVLDDDFDATCIVSLLKIRVKAPKAFDEVLWRFPIAVQKTIVHRMHDLKDTKVVPEASIPEVKEQD